MDFQIPEDLQSEYGEITTAMKKKILGLNMAGLYDIEVPEHLQLKGAHAGAEPALSETEPVAP